MHLIKNSGFLLFLVIPLFRPGIVQFLPSFSVLGFDLYINDIFNVWLIATTIILLTLSCVYGKITKLIVPVIVYFTVLLISTIYNSGNFISFMSAFISSMAVCLLFSIAIIENQLGLLKVLSRYLGVIVVVNFALLFVFEGYIFFEMGAERYFIGHRNTITTLSLLTILSTCAYSYITKKFSVTSILIVVAILATHFAYAHFITWSATGIMSDFILIACILLISFKWIRPVLSFPLLFSINVFLFFAIVIFRLQENFAFIIQDILGRSLTFTGRTPLWDAVLSHIAQAPIIGHGFGQAETGFMIEGWYMHNAHNLVLEILVRGGFLSLFAYLAIVFFAGIALIKHKSHPISSLFSAGIFVVLIAGLMESYFNSAFIFAIYTLSFHVDRVIAAQESFAIDIVKNQTVKCEMNKDVGIST